MNSKMQNLVESETVKCRMDLQNAERTCKLQNGPANTDVPEKCRMALDTYLNSAHLGHWVYHIWTMDSTFQTPFSTSPHCFALCLSTYCSGTFRIHLKFTPLNTGAVKQKTDNRFHLRITNFNSPSTDSILQQTNFVALLSPGSVLGLRK